MVLRRQAQARSLAVLLAALVWGAAVDWGHGGWDDPGCTTPIHSDSSPRSITAAPPAPTPGSNHCDLCHLLRLLHNAVSFDTPHGDLLACAAEVRPTDAVAGTKLFATHVASRAPPRLHS